ncbi:transposase [Rhizobium sp. BR 317]|uniref:IS66 family transposase n=1 Tax=Rhizobium sp. BR 317 TaxID=3040015 RepID=UPI001FE5A000|nr:transposase [Rhizobium paranaense]
MLLLPSDDGSTGSSPCAHEALDKLLERLHRRKNELLKVLDHPEIPLHTNASQNALRSFVTKRKISGGTMSPAQT